MKNIQEEYTKRTLVMISQLSVTATVNNFSDPYTEQAKQQLYTKASCIVDLKKVCQLLGYKYHQQFC